jgi:hypothetical protein
MFVEQGTPRSSSDAPPRVDQLKAAVGGGDGVSQQPTRQQLVDQPLAVSAEVPGQELDNLFTDWSLK